MVAESSTIRWCVESDSAAVSAYVSNVSGDEECRLLMSGCAGRHAEQQIAFYLCQQQPVCRRRRDAEWSVSVSVFLDKQHAVDAAVVLGVV